MGAGETSTDEKTSKNRPKQGKTVILAPKRPLQLSKFKFFNSKFEPLLAMLVSNIAYMKRLRSMGAGETSTDEKTSKNRPKQCKTAFWRQNDRYSSKFKFLNSKFEFQASFCTTNLKYYMYEASAEYGRQGGLHRRENVEKQAKTVQNSILAPKRPLQLKIQIFEFKI